MLLFFSQMQSIPAAMACLTLAGIVQSMSMIAIAVILMQTAGERFRGRVMGVRMLTIYGLPIGLMAAGSLIDAVGFSATIMIYVAVGLSMLMAIALHWRASAQRAQVAASAR
jgi:SNF family Na+-dependent transporter